MLVTRPRRLPAVEVGQFAARAIPQGEGSNCRCAAPEVRDVWIIWSQAQDRPARPTRISKCQLPSTIGLEDLPRCRPIARRERVGDTVDTKGGLEDRGTVDGEGSRGCEVPRDGEIIAELEAIRGIEECERFIVAVTPEGEDGIRRRLILVQREVPFGRDVPVCLQRAGQRQVPRDREVIAELEAVGRIEPGEDFTQRIGAEDDADIVTVEVGIEGDARGEAHRSGCSETILGMEDAAGGGTHNFEEEAGIGCCRGVPILNEERAGHDVAALIHEASGDLTVGEARGAGIEVVRPDELSCAVRLQDLARACTIPVREGVRNIVDPDGRAEGRCPCNDECPGAREVAGDVEVIIEAEAVIGDIPDEPLRDGRAELQGDCARFRGIGIDEECAAIGSPRDDSSRKDIPSLQNRNGAAACSHISLIDPVSVERERHRENRTAINGGSTRIDIEDFVGGIRGTRALHLNLQVKILELRRRVAREAWQRRATSELDGEVAVAIRRHRLDLVPARVVARTGIDGARRCRVGRDVVGALPVAEADLVRCRDRLAVTVEQVAVIHVLIRADCRGDGALCEEKCCPHCYEEEHPDDMPASARLVCLLRLPLAAIPCVPIPPVDRAIQTTRPETDPEAADDHEEDEKAYAPIGGGASRTLWCKEFCSPAWLLPITEQCRRIALCASSRELLSELSPRREKVNDFGKQRRSVASEDRYR